MERYAEGDRLNRLVDHGNRQRGIITAGLPFLSLMDVLETAAPKPDILKLGMVYPIPRETIAAFLQTHEAVKVLEELDPLLEQEIKTLAFDRQLPVRIIGKTDPQEYLGEYTPDKVRTVLSATWPDLLPAAPAAPADMPQVPARPAQMCPGCGHRSAFYAIKGVLDPTDITVADIGCHTLGYLPPYQLGQLLMCMGASPGIGSGLRLFNETRRVLVFLGDSTFFHAGLPGIVNAVFNNHDITLVLMENGTTAMTGHQDHAASGRNFNAVTDKIPVRKVLEGLGVRHIFEADTYQQARLADQLRQALDVSGFSVVIARHPCMLKFTRERRQKKGFKAMQVAIDQAVCDRNLTCVAAFGCPTFTRDDSGRVFVNEDLCIGDGSCVQTCPTSAITAPKSRTDKDDPT